MNKSALIAGVLFVIVGIMPLTATEGDIHVSDIPDSEFIRALLNNQYLLENIRLVGLAEESFAEGKYDEALGYAAEAMRYAELSDEYVSLQMKIKAANDAIAEAQARLGWARESSAARRHAELLGEAEAAFAEALDFRSREEWDEARESALQVLAILERIPGASVLPAQYLVRNWHDTRDCLWNIAAMEEIYGDPWQWRRLYEANRDKMPEAGNPDLIHPGMVLDIPSIRGELRSGILEER